MKINCTPLILLLGIGCKSIIMNKMQIRNPAIESSRSIIDFATAYHLDSNNIYVLRDSTVFNMHLKSKLEIPDAFFFNRKGEFITYKKTTQDCNAHIGNFLQEIDSISALPASSQLTLKKFSEGFISLQSHENMKVDEGDNEISIVITSAKYLGKLNKDKVFDWEEIVQKLRAAGHKIRYYKVFFDYMDFWGMKEEDLFKIR
jgi:hypothetical protein